VEEKLKLAAGPSSNFEFGVAELAKSFVVDDGVNGYELWKSDGTSAGTVLVRNTNSGIDSSYPSSPQSSEA